MVKAAVSHCVLWTQCRPVEQLTDTFSPSIFVFTVVCPAGSFSSEGACLLCPQGTYQDEEGRDFCNKCPRGSSPAGASSVNQCEGVSPEGKKDISLSVNKKVCIYSVCVCVCVCVCVSGVTECQRRGLRCSEQGDFLLAQPDLLSRRWRCFNSEGAELDWTSSDKPLTDDECSGRVSAANQ